MPEETSILQRYFEAEEFTDRFALGAEGAMDVIIPVVHSNELWRKNLVSFYREIPVKRLLIGDGGCVDRTLAVAREFPRVVVLDHRGYVSLGYSIRKLIEAVETEWFVYLHSDVYLPAGWFDAMRRHQGDYDWFECLQRLTVLLDYPVETAPGRAYSGSQMGRKAAFAEVLPKIEDDYLYRSEDVVIAALLERAGHRYGRVEETFHYHQQMPRRSRWQRAVKLTVEPARDEEVRELTMLVRATLKYLEPDARRAAHLEGAARRLEELGALQPDELDDWVARTNPRWRPVLRRERLRRARESALHVLHDLKVSVLALLRVLAAEAARWRSRRRSSRQRPRAG